METIIRPADPRPARRESDESLCRLARGLLEMSGYRPLTRLDCRVRDGVIELHGTVSSFFLKQMAQTAPLPLNPPRVRNCVRVR